MFSSVDSNRLVVGEIENETIAANCGPQAVTTAYRDKRDLVLGRGFDLANQWSVMYCNMVDEHTV